MICKKADNSRLSINEYFDFETFLIVEMLSQKGILYVNSVYRSQLNKSHYFVPLMTQ